MMLVEGKFHKNEWEIRNDCVEEMLRYAGNDVLGKVGDCFARWRKRLLVPYYSWLRVFLYEMHFLQGPFQETLRGRIMQTMMIPEFIFPTW